MAHVTLLVQCPMCLQYFPEQGRHRASHKYYVVPAHECIFGDLLVEVEERRYEPRHVFTQSSHDELVLHAEETTEIPFDQEPF